MNRVKSYRESKKKYSNDFIQLKTKKKERVREPKREKFQLKRYFYHIILHYCLLL